MSRLSLSLSVSLRLGFNVIFCSLAKQKVSQADRESEVCGYREQVEILKSKNNVSTVSGV